MGPLVDALLDTGSSISIIYLNFFLKLAAKNREPTQSKEEWGTAVKMRLQPTTVTLRSYGGGELPIVSQVQCCIKRDHYNIDTVLQVQKEAPVELLLGTDTLPLLGYALVQSSKHTSKDLLNETRVVTNLSTTDSDSHPKSTSTDINTDNPVCRSKTGRDCETHKGDQNPCQTAEIVEHDSTWKQVEQ